MSIPEYVARHERDAHATIIAPVAYRPDAGVKGRRWVDPDSQGGTAWVDDGEQWIPESAPVGPRAFTLDVSAGKTKVDADVGAGVILAKSVVAERWQPNTAYGFFDLVRTPEGEIWFNICGGTSGNTEPNWLNGYAGQTTFVDGSNVVWAFLFGPWLGQRQYWNGAIVHPTDESNEDVSTWVSWQGCPGVSGATEPDFGSLPVSDGGGSWDTSSAPFIYPSSFDISIDGFVAQPEGSTITVVPVPVGSSSLTLVTNQDSPSAALENQIVSPSSLDPQSTGQSRQFVYANGGWVPVGVI